MFLPIDIVDSKCQLSLAWEHPKTYTLPRWHLNSIGETPIAARSCINSKFECSTSHKFIYLLLFLLFLFYFLFVSLFLFILFYYYYFQFQYQTISRYEGGFHI